MKTSFTLRFAAAALAAIAALACSKDDTSAPCNPGNPDTTAPYTITATMDDGSSSETRISATDDGSTKIELKWKSGDKIYVRTDNSTNYTLYTFTAGQISQDGKSASFTCPDFPNSEAPAQAIHQGAASISYFYPTQAKATDVNVYDQSVYCHDAASLADHLPLYACYDGTKLIFHPIAAILKIKATLPATVSGQPEGFSIAARNDPAAFYPSSYDLTSGTPVRTSSKLWHVAIFQPAEAFSLPTNKTITLYAIIQPGEESAQVLDFDLQVGRHVCSALVNGAKLEAGKCYTITLPAAKWTVGAIWGSGEGNDAQPFLIQSEEHLRSLARAVRTGNTFYGKYFRLENDIALTDTSEPWLPIGGYVTSFMAGFDGGNHTVSGTFRLSDVHGNYLGFFGDTDQTKLSNLTVSGDMIYESDRAVSGLRIGGISGNPISTTFTGCKHIGSLTVVNAAIPSSGTVYVGGIAGYTAEALTGCTQSGGTITVDTPQARVYAGGICSYTTTSAYTKIHTCRNESPLVIRRRDGYAGTLVGYNNGMVYNCSTASADATITVNGTAVTPAPLIGDGGKTTNCNKGH